MSEHIDAEVETEILRKLIEVPTKVEFWGQEHTVIPRLVSEVFGDGKQLIQLSPLNSRPNYYAVRIDSAWNLNNHGEGPLLYDHLDDIYDAIEDEYGKSVDGEDMECGHCGLIACQACCDRADCWPELNLDYGSEWWWLDWPSSSAQLEAKHEAS